MNRTGMTVLVCAAFGLAASAARGQSLFSRKPPAPMLGSQGGKAQAPSGPEGPFYAASLTATQPPPPRSFQVHDLVTIIVEETSSQKAEQKLKTDKKYDLKDSVGDFIDVNQLMELILTDGLESGVGVEVNGDHKFDGKGTYERSDRFSAKIQAEVIDIKPNGVLVVEARKYIEKDEEKQTYTLSGACRTEDVTKSNTVLSSQLADVVLVVKNEGQAKDAGNRGLIPRVLDTLFAF